MKSKQKIFLDVEKLKMKTLKKVKLSGIKIRLPHFFERNGYRRKMTTEGKITSVDEILKIAQIENSAKKCSIEITYISIIEEI